MTHDKCKTEYCEKHDAYYCKDHDIWTEDTCDALECEFCKDRPEKPSLVKEENPPLG